MLEKCKRNILDCCSHSILCIYGSYDNWISKCTFAVLNAYRLEIRNGCKVLPYLAFKTILCEFLTEYSVRLTNSFKSVTSDSAKTANTKTGTGERLTIYHIIRQTESFSDSSYFILEQKLERLNKLKLQILGKSAYIVVSLYAVALDDVGVNCALSQELNAVLLARLFLKYADKLGADDFSLFFGLGNACELVKEAVNSVNLNKVCVHPVAEHLYDLLGLALAEKSVIYMYANEVFADSFYKQRGNDRAVNSARKRQKHLLIADLRAQGGKLLVDKGVRQLARRDALHGRGTFVVCHSVILHIILSVFRLCCPFLLF